MIAMLDNAVKNGFMTDNCNRLYTVAKTEQEVFEQLDNYVPFTYNKYDYLEQNGENSNG